MKLTVRILIAGFMLLISFNLWSGDEKPVSYLELALQAEKWIHTAAIPLEIGLTWHPYPDVKGFSGDNLDFEKEIMKRDLTSWSGFAEKGAFGIDSSVYRNGKQSGFLKNEHKDSHSGLYQVLYLGLQNDRHVSLGGYLKTKDLKGSVTVSLYTFGGAAAADEESYTHTPEEAGDDWTRFRLQAEIPKGCDLVHLEMVLKGEGQAWFDDFAIHFTKPRKKCFGEFIPSHTNLYSGTPGVILFYLELFKYIENRDFLNQAAAGGDYLLAHIQKNKKFEHGLYIGTGGFLFTLERLYNATGDQKYKSAIHHILSYIETMANKQKKAIIYPVAEILYGGAGDGLALLHLHRELKLNKAKDMAVKIGNGLVDSTLDKMKMMPNFAHGISGVGYFLACLYRATGDKKFLQKALEIAGYLEGISEENCLIYHDTGRKDLFYLGYCHGPAGTARFFFRLYQITGEKKWLDRVFRSAEAIIRAGIPQDYTPGYWNNLGLCCGHAGVAEFFLGLYRESKNEEYLKFVKTLTKDLISKRIKTDTGGIKWQYAEHNRQREFTLAQTGLMQGAAGIGLWLLHLDAFEKSEKPFIILPDFPF